MNKKYLRLLSFLCLAILISACRPAPVRPAAPTSLPGFTATATATATVTAIPSPSLPAATPAKGVETASGVETSSVTTTESALPGAVDAGTPAPTVDATTTALVERLVATAQPLLLKAYPSPDGNSRAEVLSYPCTKVIPGVEQENAYDVLRVARLVDQQADTVQTQLQTCGGLGAFGLGGYQWSPDSRYFYYTDAREGVPDGGDIYGWYRNIFRFDTTTTQAEYLGGGLFSPDGNRLAVVRLQREGGCHPKGAAVMDITGQGLVDEPFDVPAERCGQAYLDWSPDGNGLAYTLAICAADGTDCHSALYRIDLANDQGSSQMLLEDQPTQFTNIAWNSPERLELWSLDGHWFYDLATGQLERQPQ